MYLQWQKNLLLLKLISLLTDSPKYKRPLWVTGWVYLHLLLYALYCNDNWLSLTLIELCYAQSFNGALGFSIAVLTSGTLVPKKGDSFFYNCNNMHERTNVRVVSAWRLSFARRMQLHSIHYDFLFFNFICCGNSASWQKAYFSYCTT